MSWRAAHGTLVRATEYAAGLVALGLFVVGSAMTALGELWVAQLGSLSSVGMASGSALYLLSELRFRSRGEPAPRSMVLALLFANAFLQSYEIVYGLSFLPEPTGALARTVILWLLMVAPLVLMVGHLHFNRATSLPLLLLFAAVWATWLLYGYPQYYTQGYLFPPVLKTSDPFHLSLWLNFGSKAVLAAFYASLLDPASGIRAALRRVR